MTDNRDLLLPLMATAFPAYLTSRIVCPEPIYRVPALNFLPQRPDTRHAEPHAPQQHTEHKPR